ncbi:MAG: hypothetical protein ACRD3S_06240, partial [Terracidiphilus sp.]
MDSRYISMIRASVCIALVVLLLSCCQREISGSYIGKDPNDVYNLQLVKTPDGHLMGQLEGAQLKPDGNLEHVSIGLSGAADGDSIVLSATALGFQVLTLSGNFHGSRLTLTGAQPDPIVLTRSDLNEYNLNLKALAARSQGILAQRKAAAEHQAAAIAAAAERQKIASAHQQFLAQIDGLIQQMESFNTQADVHLSRFPGADGRLRAITEKIEKYVNRERQLAGNPNAGVARAQLAVAANQASMATGQLHNSLESLRSSFQNDAQPFEVKIANLVQGCRAPNFSSELTPGQVAESKAA